MTLFQKENYMWKKCGLTVLILLIAFLQVYAQDNVKEISFKQVNTSESDEIRTLKSLQKINNIYTITYYGDYNERLDETKRRILTEGFPSVTILRGGEVQLQHVCHFRQSG